MDPNLDKNALARQNTMMQALMGRLSQMGGGLMGGGMAGQAAQTLQNDPYMKYAQEQQVLGLQPKPREQWMLEMQQQAPRGLLGQ